VQACFGSLKCERGSMKKPRHEALMDAAIDGVAGRHARCRFLPDFRLGSCLAFSEPMCCVAYDVTSLTKHNSGQAEHADTTARPILSSSSLPISSISFDPNEAKRLDGRS
jgi:hypothetical protein